MKSAAKPSGAKAHLGVEEPDHMRLALAMCESGRLEYHGPTSCRMSISFAAPEEEQWWTLDLSDFWLPATAQLARCRLSDDARLMTATVLAVDAYLTSVGSTKATHSTVTAMISHIAKLWEWGRLQGIYRPEDWVAVHFRMLERDLAVGKWTVASQIQNRVAEHLAQRPDRSLFLGDNGKIVVRDETRTAIGTNLQSREFGSAKKLIRSYVHPGLAASSTDESPFGAQPTYTWLAQMFWAANLLVRIPSPFAFKVTPFPEPVARAKRLAKQTSRTATLSVDQAVGLLLHARKFIFEYSDSIIALVTEVGRITFQLKAMNLTKDSRLTMAPKLWSQSAVRADAERILGTTIALHAKGRGDGTNISRLVGQLMTAGVVIIAGMNARRKGEIIHKGVGLRRDSMRIVHQELGIFEGTFYIEKTYKSYVPYFVNAATFETFTVLRRLEEAQLAVEATFEPGRRTPQSLQHSMFWRRTCAPYQAKLNKRVWFDFSFGSDDEALEFASAAMGDASQMFKGGAHVFRRFYAIIYFYRFEHGGLLAVRYQLGHWNCEQARQYVTDAMIQATEARIPIELRRPSEQIRGAIEGDWKGLDEALVEVGIEKLQHVVESMLDGQQFSGGFPRLVERIHRRLMAGLDYSAMDNARKAAALQRKLASRGHALRPLPHADCAAGASPARGAKCSTKDRRGVASENAAPEICASCPYSWTSAGHVDGMKADLPNLDAEAEMLPKNSVHWQQNRASRANLERVIWLHETRLGRPGQ